MTTATYFHVSSHRFAAGDVVESAKAQLERHESEGNAFARMMLVARMRAKWGEAPFFGHRSILDVDSSLIDGIMGEGGGAFVWMVDTIEDAREIQSQMGAMAKIYEVIADSVEYRAEDGFGDEYPTSDSATVVCEVSN